MCTHLDIEQCVKTVMNGIREVTVAFLFIEGSLVSDGTAYYLEHSIGDGNVLNRTYICSHFFFPLELSLHKQQKMFTVESLYSFLLKGSEDQEGCLNFIATQYWGANVLLK